MLAKLYKFDMSPPARAAMMLVDLLEIPIEMIDVNLLKGEHLKAEYLKINSQHTIPVLVDGDLNIADSHAIMMYLSDAYSKEDDFYSKKSKERAMVNQRLFFDTAILQPRLKSVTYSLYTEGVAAITDKQIEDIHEAYSFLEEFLCKTKYLAGNYLTIADLSAYATVSSLIHILPVSSKRYLRVCIWLEDIERKSFAIKYNAPGVAEFGKFLTERIKSQ